MTPEEARDHGTQAALDRADAILGKWSDRARFAIVQFGRSVQRPFLADEVRKSGLVEEPPHPNSWGAVFNHAAKQGIIQQAGFGRPKNLKSHGGIVMLWEIA